MPPKKTDVGKKNWNGWPGGRSVLSDYNFETEQDSIPGFPLEETRLIFDSMSIMNYE